MRQTIPQGIVHRRQGKHSDLNTRPRYVAYNKCKQIRRASDCRNVGESQIEVKIKRNAKPRRVSPLNRQTRAARVSIASNLLFSPINPRVSKSAWANSENRISAQPSTRNQVSTYVYFRTQARKIPAVCPVPLVSNKKHAISGFCQVSNIFYLFVAATKQALKISQNSPQTDRN